MYKPETIERYKAAMTELVNEYKANIDNVNVSISKGNTKIGHAFNVSIAPVITCANCDGCAPYCYDVRDSIRHGLTSTAMRARAKNTALLFTAPEKYFGQIDEFISKYNGKYKLFRWHVGGEITNVKYALEIIRIAAKHPDWIFWTYTKHFSVVNRAIGIYKQQHDMPANLHIMFSRFLNMPCDNPHGMPEFQTVSGITLDEYMADIWRWGCPGNCDVCKAAHRGCIAGETTYNGLH